MTDRAMRTVATVVYFSVYEAIKKNVKADKNNDNTLDEKPTCNESDVIDKDLNTNDWYKVKRSTDEVPAIRDVIDPDLMKEAWATKFIDEITVAAIKMADEVYTRFQPVYEKEKEKDMAKEKIQVDTLKESKNLELAKSQFTSIDQSKKILEGVQIIVSKSTGELQEIQPGEEEIEEPGDD